MPISLTQRKLQTTNKDQNGFTMMEVLIIMVVIGILALLILNSVVGVRASSRDAKRRHDIASIRRGLVGYSIDNDSALVANSGKVGGGTPGLGWFNYKGAPDYTGTSIEEGLRAGGYIAEGVIDPRDGENGYMIYPCAGASLVGVFTRMEKPTSADANKVAEWTSKGCPVDPVGTYDKNAVEVVPLVN